ncbi:MAG: CDP-glucose 4,6-dehydratase [Elusimicrobiaceae bacterium]|nr:CDP-glucose 4,6-dehydratase [Elusimicrobiota bacterium]MDY6039675.1 CDP-glucose 4,6-dehydratase [Elusimicrobiaceae bacterium]
MFADFYRGKRVLVTGHSGFKGSWLSLWLAHLGCEVCGYSLAPETSPSMFNELGIESKIQKNVFASILNTQTLEETFAQFRPQIVFHLAAQPLVRLSYAQPVLTYQTNVMGSLNVLEAARKTPSVKAFVNITTDKCYENKENGRNFEETDPFGGYDPYSSSKACVEILSASYRNSFLQEPHAYSLATARAGNVIGGGDWAADRIVPDCIRAIMQNKEIEIRSPHSVRPWQHVLEPLGGYLLLGEKLFNHGKTYAEGFNFGPTESSVLTVEDLVRRLIGYLGRGSMKICRKDNLHEANLLMLSIQKAFRKLNWKPVLTADEAIRQTAEWYSRFYAGENMFDFTLKQIEDYQEKLHL